MSFVAKSVGFFDGILDALRESDWSRPPGIIELLELLQLDRIKVIQVPDDAESNDEEQDWGYGVPGYTKRYLRISAWTAGECLTPILLPYSSSSVYPS